MRSTRATALLSVSLVLVGGALSALPARAATGAGFSPPLLLAGGGAEPSIRVPADGRSAAYVSAPSGLGSNFWRITDQRNANGTHTFLQSPVQQPDLGTGGGDSEISVGNKPVGESRCDTIAYSGLHNVDLLDNFTVAVSTDCGEHFQLANPYATQNTLTDRQWQAFDGDKTNFLIYHKVDTSQIVVSESVDGGQTYVSLAPDGAHGIIDAATLPAAANANQVGNIAVDYSHPTGSSNLLSGEASHRMYAVFGAPRDAADNAQSQVDTNAPGAAYNHVDTVYLARSDDGGLTWTDTKVYSVDPKSRRELNLLFPVVDVDKQGNVYVVWSDGFKVEYAASTDGGKTFSKPFQVNRDNTGLVAGTGAEKPDPGKSDLFPWLAAGADGYLDVVWYHGEGGAPTSNLAYRDPGDAKTSWTVAFSQLGNAHKASGGRTTPTVLNYSEAITPAVHTGDICQNGTFCSLVPVPGAPFSTGDRSLLDFFEVAIDKQGRANVALADNAAAPGSLISGYTRQTTGVNLLTGKPLTPQTITLPKVVCPLGGAFTDASGDANTVAVAQAPIPSAPGLDITKGYLTYDAAKKVVTLHTKVLDLSQLPATGSTGEEYEFGFTFDKVGFATTVQRNAGTGDSYGVSSTTGVALKGVTGRFDTKSNEVQVDIPGGAFAAAKLGTVVGKGSTFVASSAQSRRVIGTGLAPVTDVAGSLGCPFVVGARATSVGGTTGPVGTGTVPGQVDGRPVPGGRLASTGLPAGLPVLAAGLLLGTALALRRRLR
ncbi:MAG: hypothetical protein JWO22_4119 [Frankiales bacterium]|nr:hypothetical protein [Frankiales bacterium]